MAINNDIYYTTKSKKVIDFMLGFFGPSVVMYLLAVLFGLFTNIFSSANGFVAQVFGILPIISLIAFIVLISHFKKIGRRYISLGMISTFIVPLLLFGACFLSLSGLNR